MVYRSSNKDIVLTGSYEFDWLSTMVRWEFKLKSLDFIWIKITIIKKRCLGIIGSS